MPLEPDPYARNVFIKSAIEDALGAAAFYKLKETRDHKVWVKTLCKVLKSYKVASDASVKIADISWRMELHQLIDEAYADVSKSKDFDTALDHFTAALIRLCYLQIGHIPRLKGRTSRTSETALRAENWDFSKIRSVQYVQSTDQMNTAFIVKLQRKNDPHEVWKVFREYEKTKSLKTFEIWLQSQNISSLGLECIFSCN